MWFIVILSVAEFPVCLICCFRWVLCRILIFVGFTGWVFVTGVLFVFGFMHCGFRWKAGGIVWGLICYACVWLLRRMLFRAEEADVC